MEDVIAKFKSWDDVLALIEFAFKNNEHDLLLNILLTEDERVALTSRANIIDLLLNSEMSQRNISKLLGVGVATITRGSNELKRTDEQTKKTIQKLISSSIN